MTFSQVAKFDPYGPLIIVTIVIIVVIIITFSLSLSVQDQPHQSHLLARPLEMRSIEKMKTRMKSLAIQYFKGAALVFVTSYGPIKILMFRRLRSI